MCFSLSTYEENWANKKKAGIFLSQIGKSKYPLIYVWKKARKKI